MDSSGRILRIEDDRIVSRSERPVPELGRGHLVMAALEAGEKKGWPAWWPELAPLNRKERQFVREQRKDRP